MISFTSDQLNSWIGQYLWPFVRLLALISSAPLFSQSAIPSMIKVGLAFALTAAVAPALGPMPHIDLNSYQAILIIIQQTLIGLAMGMVMQILFAAVEIGGEFIGLQMGLSFASFFDPTQGATTAVMQQFFNILTLMLFMAFDGHLLLLSTLVHSFEILPVGLDALNSQGWMVVVEWGSHIFSSGLLMALPIICALLTMNLAMGVLNRAAPQLTVFSIGFPISLICGLILLTAVVPHSSKFYESLFQQGYEMLNNLLLKLAGR